ncbi:peptidoglycan-binding protein [Nibricoccus aquaticus]|uniref:Peptidoglycan-binding protein n=1 Tax=Nibricoccus aquaticus TaxID=2576891 RepID=A0A290QGQ5_9BACT|nr:LysM peptidoglycan-binding domain-containing protein [Nibricoccus aquaticus]ATC63531.1 peptidoglycan-binding protein [Nibricoccus aquaticus]
MRPRFLSLALFALAALFFAAGCDRVDSMPFTAEVDEPGYRRGKELIRQGRNQEALMEFQKVIEKRGLNNAPEAHLEIGLLYQSHIRDPISAIYHFKKFRELKPSTQQAQLVGARIDAAMREFASTLPGKPLDNPLTPADNPEVVQRLERENEQLRAALARMRVSAGLPARVPVDASGNLAQLPAEETPAIEASPISASSTDEFVVTHSPFGPETPAFEPVTTPSFTPTRPAPQQAAVINTPAPRPAQTPPPQTPPATTTGRRHVVRQGEGLWTIARRYYGTPTAAQVDGIYTANRDRMSSKSDLKVGMELRIP